MCTDFKEIGIFSKSNALFFEIIFLFLCEFVKWNDCFDVTEIMGFHQSSDTDIVYKHSGKVSVIKYIADVLVAKCVINWNCGVAVQQAGDIKDCPFRPIPWEQANELERLTFRFVEKFFVMDGWADLHGKVLELAIINIYNMFFFPFLSDNGAKTIVRGVELKRIIHGNFHGGETGFGTVS